MDTQSTVNSRPQGNTRQPPEPRCSLLGEPIGLHTKEHTPNATLATRGQIAWRKKLFDSLHHPVCNWEFRMWACENRILCSPVVPPDNLHRSSKSHVTRFGVRMFDIVWVFMGHELVPQLDLCKCVHHLSPIVGRQDHQTLDPRNC